MHSAADPPQPPQQQPWGGAAAGGALGPHPSGAHQAAEEGKAAPGSPAGSDGKPAKYPSGPAPTQAPTFAERLAAEGGALRSRGHLAAALCKARQDVLLSVFVTRPACWSPLFNVLQEFIAMTIM